uniref:acetyl-CoA carboxylase beta subunit n=1 Tax=Schisandra repanda TaxID=81864 RepID=UPI001FAFAE5E|nr:acetyl-CoA carboxylase beta subunit [Schisandra repanda]UJI65423.1 acetyl-CoA carboxylase beta subunit [Schisandra repanda]
MTIHLSNDYSSIVFSNRRQEYSMEKWWFNSMLSNEEFEHKCGLSKSAGRLGPIGNASGSETPIINGIEKNILSWGNNGSYSCSNVYHLFGVRGILSFIFDETFLVRDRNGDSYSVYLDIEKQIFEIHNDSDFLSELESSFSSYLNSGPKSYNRDYDCYMYDTYDTKYSLNNHINSCIDSYLRSQISIDSYIYNSICSESLSGRDSESSSIRTSVNRSYFNIRTRGSIDLQRNPKYGYLWVQCEKCYELNYQKVFSSQLRICEHCGHYLKMSSSDRIELSIDPGTWDPMDEDMISTDPIKFHSDGNLYRDQIDSFQRKTGLTEAVQTGIGQLNGIPVAIGVMDFHFMGGSMGTVVGEKITRLLECATTRSLPVIVVCASGGARMQEGSLSLMQMAKVSSALYNYQYNYQSNKKLFYVSILTSPTTGGVTASFGMLGDIVIAEPNAHIAFAGKRVIEQTLKKTVPDDFQSSEYLFHKGLLDLIVPRNPLKGVPSELFQLHGFFPLNQINK